MGFTYENLDELVRQAMVNEISTALATETLYLSERLTDKARETWPHLLRSAATSHDDEWLASQLQIDGMLVSFETTKNGQTKRVPIPSASTMLAEGQFNLFYCQAVCTIAMASGEATVEIYRAKESKSPRPESNALVGTLLPAVKVLSDLRQSGGIETDVGLIKPNSGLSIRRIR